MVKKFGKFFIKEIPEGTKEYERWVKECTAILWDVKTDQDVLDLFCKLKKVTTKGEESAGGNKFFYIPELNKTEAAIVTVGHHCNHDGISQFQAYYQWSDCQAEGEYPFLKRKAPSSLQWAIIYLTAFFTWIPALKHYTGRKADKNCIKKHGIYMSGNFTCHNSEIISVKKAKEISKKMGMTLNDMMLGMTSKVFK